MLGEHSSIDAQKWAMVRPEKLGYGKPVSAGMGGRFMGVVMGVEVKVNKLVGHERVPSVGKILNSG